MSNSVQRSQGRNPQASAGSNLSDDGNQDIDALVQQCINSEDNADAVKKLCAQIQNKHSVGPKQEEDDMQNVQLKQKKSNQSKLPEAKKQKQNMNRPPSPSMHNISPSPKKSKKMSSPRFPTPNMPTRPLMQPSMPMPQIRGQRVFDQRKPRVPLPPQGFPSGMTPEDFGDYDSDEEEEEEDEDDDDDDFDDEEKETIAAMLSKNSAMGNKSNPFPQMHAMLKNKANFPSSPPHSNEPCNTSISIKTPHSSSLGKSSFNTPHIDSSKNSSLKKTALTPSSSINSSVTSTSSDVPPRSNPPFCLVAKSSQKSNMASKSPAKKINISQGTTNISCTQSNDPNNSLSNLVTSQLVDTIKGSASSTLMQSLLGLGSNMNPGSGQIQSRPRLSTTNASSSRNLLPNAIYSPRMSKSMLMETSSSDNDDMSSLSSQNYDENDIYNTNIAKNLYRAQGHASTPSNTSVKASLAPSYIMSMAMTPESPDKPNINKVKSNAPSSLPTSSFNDSNDSQLGSNISCKQPSTTYSQSMVMSNACTSSPTTCNSTSGFSQASRPIAVCPPMKAGQCASNQPVMNDNRSATHTSGNNSVSSSPMPSNNQNSTTNSNRNPTQQTASSSENSNANSSNKAADSPDSTNVNNYVVGQEYAILYSNGTTVNAVWDGTHFKIKPPANVTSVQATSSDVPTPATDVISQKSAFNQQGNSNDGQNINTDNRNVQESQRSNENQDNHNLDSTQSSQMAPYLSSSQIENLSRSTLTDEEKAKLLMRIQQQRKESRGNERSMNANPSDESDYSYEDEEEYEEYYRQAQERKIQHQKKQNMYMLKKGNFMPNQQNNYNYMNPAFYGVDGSENEFDMEDSEEGMDEENYAAVCPYCNSFSSNFEICDVCKKPLPEDVPFIPNYYRESGDEDMDDENHEFNKYKTMNNQKYKKAMKNMAMNPPLPPKMDGSDINPKTGLKKKRENLPKKPRKKKTEGGPPAKRGRPKKNKDDNLSDKTPNVDKDKMMRDPKNFPVCPSCLRPSPNFKTCIHCNKPFPADYEHPYPRMYNESGDEEMHSENANYRKFQSMHNEMYPMKDSSKECDSEMNSSLSEVQEENETTPNKGVKRKRQVIRKEPKKKKDPKEDIPKNKKKGRPPAKLAKSSDVPNSNDKDIIENNDDENLVKLKAPKKRIPKTDWNEGSEMELNETGAKRKFRSKLWKFFIKTDDGQAQCKLCGEIVHRNRGTTWAMGAHLKKKSDEHEKALLEQLEESDEDIDKMLDTENHKRNENDIDMMFEEEGPSKKNDLDMVTISSEEESELGSQPISEKVAFEKKAKTSDTSLDENSDLAVSVSDDSSPWKKKSFDEVPITTNRQVVDKLNISYEYAANYIQKLVNYSIHPDALKVAINAASEERKILHKTRNKDPNAYEEFLESAFNIPKPWKPLNDSLDVKNEKCSDVSMAPDGLMISLKMRGVRLGTLKLYNYSELTVSSLGLKFSIPIQTDGDPFFMSVHARHITKVHVHLGEDLNTLFIQTTPECAAKIRENFSMSMSHYHYNPQSEAECHRRLTYILDNMSKNQKDELTTIIHALAPCDDTTVDTSKEPRVKELSFDEANILLTGQMQAIQALDSRLDDGLDYGDETPSDDSEMYDDSEYDSEFDGDGDDGVMPEQGLVPYDYDSFSGSSMEDHNEARFMYRRRQNNQHFSMVPRMNQHQSFHSMGQLPYEMMLQNSHIYQAMNSGAVTHLGEGFDEEEEEADGEIPDRSRSPSPPPSQFHGNVCRLYIYPPPPATGGIAVSNEDFFCLNDGEFLNDVIIDFYLKYIMMEILSAEDRERTHVFSSFFYRRLTQGKKRGDDDAHLTPAQRRHGRVKSWTKNVDLFKKDFIIVPVNESAHWYLAIVCFAGLSKAFTMDGREIEEIDITENKSGNEDELISNIEKDATDIAEPEPCEPIDQAPQSENEIKVEDPLYAIKQESLPIEQEVIEPKVEEVESKTEEMSIAEPVEEPIAENAEVKSEIDKVENDENPSTNEPEIEVKKEEESLQPIEDAGNNISAPIKTEMKEEPKEEEHGEPVKQPCILIFDSLAGPSRSHVIRTLREYLSVEWDIKKKNTEGERTFDKDNFKGTNPRCPQQSNFSDCGVYLLQYVEAFYESPILDYNIPIKTVSNWFPEEIVLQKRRDLQELIISLQRKINSSLDYDYSIDILPGS